MNPLPCSVDGEGEAAQRRSQRSEPSTTRHDPVPPRAERDEDRAAQADREPDQHADGKLEQRAALGRLTVVSDAQLGGGDGQRERDDRGHDAVVESTLHIEQPSKSHGNAAGR